MSRHALIMASPAALRSVKVWPMTVMENMNESVKMFKYVSKGTFDAYNWGLVERKQKFIAQVTADSISAPCPASHTA